MLRIYNLNTNCRRVITLYLIPLGLRRNERKAFFLLYRIRVLKDDFKFFDWQLAQNRVYFVPLYENKKI